MTQTGGAGAMPIAYSALMPAAADDIYRAEFVAPFPGHEIIVDSLVFADFKVDIPDIPSLTFRDLSVRYSTPQIAPATCNTEVEVLAISVALPSEVALAGTSLETATPPEVGVVDGEPLMLSWSLGDPALSSLTIVTVNELVPVGTQTELTRLSIVWTRATHVQLDPSLFVAGHAYAVSLTVFPRASDLPAGDFVTRAPPQEAATAWYPLIAR